MKLLGATGMSMKESQVQNNSSTLNPNVSTMNPNVSGTKNAFGLSDPKLESKLSKTNEKEKSPY